MFHTAAYTASVDQAALAAIAAVADPVLTISGNNLQVPSATPALGLVFANGVNITRAQLQSPSLRRVINYEVRAVNRSVTPLSPNPILDIMGSPIDLDPGEQLQAWTAEDGAGATRMNVIVNFVDKAVNPVQDKNYNLRCTGATTLVAFSWTNGAIVFDQVLPVGQYAIVGARAESAGLIAFRFVFQNQTPRPGGIGVLTESGLTIPGQRNGGWGVWGTFDNWTIPTVDYFSATADTAEILTLDLVKIG
jgi:hypothetical protein